MPDLNQLANSYDEAARDADRVIALEMASFLAQLRTYAAQVAHKQTGRLSRSFYVDGPVRRVGVVEGAVKPGVVYAEDEVRKGGAHDYASITLKDNAGAIQGWADETAVAIVRKVGGVS